MALSPTDLKTLLRLAFADQITWLSPIRAETPLVRWVCSTLTRVQPGDLLLVAGAELGSDSILKASHTGASAVLVLNNVEEQVDFTESPLPVVLHHSADDIREIEKLLSTILINQRAALMERGVRIHTQLAQIEAEGGGLSRLVEGIAELSGRGVVIQDKRLAAVAHAASPVLSAIWDELLPQLSSLKSLPDQLQNRKQAGHQAVILTQTLPGNIARLVTPIVVGEVARGYLSLVGFPNDFDPLDQVVAEQGAMVCAVEMSRAKAVREAEKRLKGDLLTALIHENLSPRDARLWAQSMSINLDTPHAALRLSWDSPDSPSRRRLETLVNGELAAQDFKATLSQMEQEIVCFCQETPQVERPLTTLALARSVIKQGAEEYPEYPIRCGVGSPAADLSTWRDSFRQAGQALVMANRFQEDKPLYFPDLSVYRLLMQIEHNPELSKFEQEILSPILATENASELLHTLETYFEHNGNLSQTADALFVHRNTLLYRMNRIAGIAGLDMEDPDTRLALQLALICHRMLDSKSN